MQSLKMVLVGCGGISDAWIDALKGRPDVKLGGLVDLHHEAAAARAAKHGLTGIEIGTDLKKMLKAVRPDVVCDCTIPEAHMPVTVTALKQGCHVFGEKPLADTLKNARKMVRVAQESGRLYGVMQNRRYMANIQALKRFLMEGGIGNVTTVHCDFFIGAHFGGFRDVMKHVLLLDMAIHTFDQARYIAGTDPLTVVAHEWNPAGSWYAHGASAMALFEMTGNVVVSYRGSWCCEGLNTPWEAEWRIIGEKGCVRWDGADGFVAEVVSEPGGFRSAMRKVEIPYVRDDLALSGHAGCLDELIQGVKTGRVPQTACTDNIKSLSMVHGAIESATRGKRVVCRWQ
jgi:predicted dehydrogenase